MSKLNHQNILKLFTIIDSKDDMHLIFEYFLAQNLKEIVDKFDKRMTEYEAKFIFL